MLLVPETAEIATMPESQSPLPAAGCMPGKDGSDASAPRSLIRHYILQNFLFTDDPTALDDSDSFLQLGIIDSVGALEIALYIEQTFGFAVREEEMLPENLDSVTRLTSFIERRLQGA